MEQTKKHLDKKAVKKQVDKLVKVKSPAPTLGKWVDEIKDVSLLKKIESLNADDLAKLEKDFLSKSNGNELKKLITSVDDLDKWKLLKDDPHYAFELVQENPNWEKWAKSNFFKEVTKKGKEFEKLCLNELKNKSSQVYKSLKSRISDLDERTILTNVELCISGKYPCKEVEEYFKPDFVAVKKVFDGDVEFLDIIIIDSKLSKTSPWTANQKEAQKIFDYVVKSSGKKMQGNLNLVEKEFVQRNSQFIKIYKENEIIKVN
ncbi:hypothetical protein [Capnocytophaga canimorsus]|uniref:hypothetical protein n=1 Tax=Capnocytophaga canimorsus TaxID=28188 RepID=UPI001562524A|nr:hypothetical protein [Capnocytophaga canimorsus]